jgi:hypothetical protein
MQLPSYSKSADRPAPHLLLCIDKYVSSHFTIAIRFPRAIVRVGSYVDSSNSFVVAYMPFQQRYVPAAVYPDFIFCTLRVNVIIEASLALRPVSLLLDIFRSQRVFTVLNFINSCCMYYAEL